MRMFLSASLLLMLLPASAMAQSTVGDVPSDPNKMPAINGSSAPAVARGDQMSRPMSENGVANQASKSRHAKPRSSSRVKRPINELQDNSTPY